MLHPFSRTELILGTEGIEILKNSCVAVIGIGGVGSFVVEGLARAGVGHLILCDHDDICLTNLNRQIHATMDTVGSMKVDVMKERILSINPEAIVDVHPILFNQDTADTILPDGVDYVVDAIDMVTSKLFMVTYCGERKIPIMASMGTGNKINPTMLEVTDIYKTSVCPLAKVMRHELKKRGVRKLKVVYSKETPIQPKTEMVDLSDEQSKASKESGKKRRSTPGSTSFVPSVAGFIIASEVIKDLTGMKNK